jgi:ATP synthase protein I
LAKPNQYGPRGFNGGGPAAIVATPRVSKVMNDGTRDNGDRSKARTEEAALSARLQRLGEGLGQARGRAGPPSDRPGVDRAATASGYARGFRLSSELVAGVVVGAGIGWLIDRWLGISPWGLIVFLLLGFAAGVLNVMRTARVVAGTALDDRTRGNPDN